jgi:hypothetical protein
MNQDKLVQVHWIGRFGNRLFEYAFGCCYAKKFGLIYYMPSEWEGLALFNKSQYAEVQPDDLLRLKINQSHKDMDTIEYRKSAIEEYNKNNNDSIKHLNFNSIDVIGEKNMCFDDLNMMYFPHCFQVMDRDFIKNVLYTFNDTIKQSELYRTLESKKGTYDVIHLRRGDISWPSYKGAHSMISKKSYTLAVQKLGFDISTFIWVSDDPKERTGHEWLDKCRNGHWKYPTGERIIPDVFFDFLPEFLIIYFARTVFRGNSAFSWWSSFLSDAKIYSPVITNKPSDKRNSFHEMDCEFVEGNHPHFMGSRGEGFNDIIF